MSSDEVTHVSSVAPQRSEPSLTSSDVAIRVNGVSKCYHLYDKPQDRLRQSIYPRMQRILGREPKAYAREFWALRDVSLHVKKAETVGIIGRNGSGKSTLLQLICGTLAPTSGTVETQGRVAALLELGAGFNPDFTGRENVYLNGALLGLNKAEIDARFDDVAAFADIGEFIEQPVKMYSSGMFVRLAFAAQTVIQPEILIVDEALAVGDAAFTAKCMRRMHRLVDSGTTVLFVSHDMGSVRQLCSRAIWLEKGKVLMAGLAPEISAAYLEYCHGETVRDFSSPGYVSQGSSASTDDGHDEIHTAGLSIRRSLQGQHDGVIRWGDGGLRLWEIEVGGPAVIGTGIIKYGERLEVTLRAKVDSGDISGRYGFGLAFRTPKGLDAITSTTIEAGYSLPNIGSGEEIFVNFSLENILASGDYFIVANIERREGSSVRYYDFVENALQVTVVSDVHVYSVVLPHVVHTVTIKKHENTEHI